MGENSIANIGQFSILLLLFCSFSSRKIVSLKSSTKLQSYFMYIEYLFDTFSAFQKYVVPTNRHKITAVCERNHKFYSTDCFTSCYNLANRRCSSHAEQNASHTRVFVFYFSQETFWQWIVNSLNWLGLGKFLYIVSYCSKLKTIEISD